MNSYQAPKELENENGEQFRSKSETIIAEKLKNNKIPYIYEYPLKLKNGKTIYPDFYILNKRTRETYYYEHFGMMDDPEYCINALRKIDDYARNEIHIGQKLLVTFEAIEKPLSIKTLEELIKNNLI